MTPDLNLKISSIVQLNPDTCRNAAFNGCLMVVTDIKPSWVQGYVQGVGATLDDMGGQFHYRATWKEIETVEDGMAIWGYDGADLLC